MLLESSTVFCPVIAHIIYCCFKLRRQGFVNRVNSFNSCSKTLFNFVDRICLLRFTYMGFCGILFRSSFVDIIPNSLCFLTTWLLSLNAPENGPYLGAVYQEKLQLNAFSFLCLLLKLELKSLRKKNNTLSFMMIVRKILSPSKIKTFFIPPNYFVTHGLLLFLLVLNTQKR